MMERFRNILGVGGGDFMITHRIWIGYMTLIPLELELLDKFNRLKFFTTGLYCYRMNPWV